MVDKQIFDQISQQISRLLPAAEEIGQDAKRSISAALHSSFQKMDLVTREEFDAQLVALARAQQRIELLEKHVQQLEELLKNQDLS